MRYHERTLGVRWKKSVRRAEKSNAIDLLCGGLPKSGTLPESFDSIQRSSLGLEESLLFNPTIRRITQYWPWKKSIDFEIILRYREAGV